IADGRRRGLRVIAAAFEPRFAKINQEHIGEGRKPQPQLVGTHHLAAHPVGEQIELLFFDPIFGIASRAIELAIESFGFPEGMIRWQVRYDEARVLSFGSNLRLAYDLPGAAPACSGTIFEFTEVSAPAAAHARVRLGPEHRRIEVSQQGDVLCHSGDVEQVVGLAPGKDRFAGKAAVGPQDDAGLRKAFADKRYYD